MSDEIYWEKFPMIFQKEVVKLLRYKDRYSLKKTCKYNSGLVDSAPIRLQELGFNSRASNTIELTLKQAILVSSDGTQDVCEYHIYGQKMFEACFKILENKNSIVDFFFVTLDHPNSMPWLEAFHEILRNRPENFKIRAKTFCWRVIDDQEYQMEVIRRLDKNSLQAIEFNCNITQDCLERVINSEQCQNVKHLTLGKRCENLPPLTSFLFANKIYAYLHRTTHQEIWDVIKNFRSTPRPIGSIFHFYSDDPIFQIPTLLSVFDVRIHNSSQRDDCHIQYFHTTFKHSVLKVKIMSRFVIGTITNQSEYERYYDGPSALF